MGKRKAGDVDGVESKKQKFNQELGKADTNGDPSAVEGPRKEREDKKLKKLKKQVADNAEAVDAAPAEKGQISPSLNGGQTSKSAEKQRRNRKKKDKKKPEVQDKSPTTTLVSQDDKDMLRQAMESTEVVGKELAVVEQEDKFVLPERATKAVRKAEKPRRKNLKEATPDEIVNGNASDQFRMIDSPLQENVQDVVGGSSKSQEDGLLQGGDHDKEDHAARHIARAIRKAEKAERKKSKAAKIASEASDASMLPNGSSDHVNGDVNNAQMAKPMLAKDSVEDTGPYIEDLALTSLPESVIIAYLKENFIMITDPTSSTPLRPIISFSHLDASFKATPSPFTAFTAPTPIQSASWPFLLSGRDVIGIAETGSGKTLAFGVPCIRSLRSFPASNAKSASTRNDKICPARAVIISPTRELAIQIHEQLTSLAISAGFSTACIYGGVPKDTQRLALATAHIIVATPGRLNDLIDEGCANLSSVNYLVLDEADRMLDKGFEDQIRNIINHTPSTSSGRQTLMFTATWPSSVRELASTFMKDPVHISIGANNPTGELRANARIVQKVEVVAPEAKQARMLQIIQSHQKGKGSKDRILAFCLYKKEAVRVENFLRSRGLSVAAIHGDMSQSSRLASLESFKSGTCSLLVATDVAARGLDIPSVKLVLNITFPLTVEDYVHRIGRTGRAGKEGLAITLFTVHEKAQAGALVNVLRAAGQEIPEELLNFGGTVKKKEHGLYGAFAKELGEGAKKATKIRFD